MKQEDKYDRLVDLLLSESVGGKEPPDVRERVLKAADELPRVAAPLRRPVPWAPPVKRSKAPAFAMAAILTLLGIAAVLIQLQHISTARTPMLSELSGSVSRPLGAIPPGGSLSTGSNSTATVSYQDGTKVAISPESTVVVTERSRWDRAKGLEIVAGGIEADVTPQAAGNPFVVASKHAHAEVVGTKFSFDLRGDRSRLEVSEGAVRFISRRADREALVKEGHFAESGKSGFLHEKIPVPGIIGFTLMNADSDEPIREVDLGDGSRIALASLPTRNINIRADYEGAAPASAIMSLSRHDGRPTGLPPHAVNAHEHPPFFVAGDHWADGRPNDCAAWTPRPGIYRLKAEAVYSDDRKESPGEALEIHFTITD
ncbi:FecR domain-containing protein [Haloferula chungangensis]|uniref:FecR domain-containing protein n=1 Tax=Haloferula chungangensis TaxID=1048331 RepID=A0ABW2L3Q3_9BACT